MFKDYDIPPAMLLRSHTFLKDLDFEIPFRYRRIAALC